MVLYPKGSRGGDEKEEKVKISVDLIDRAQLLEFIEFDRKVIAPEEHTAQDIVMMIQTAPTIAPPPNDPLTLEQMREMGGGALLARRATG